MTVLSLSAELTERQQARREITARVFSPAVLAFAVSVVRDARARGAKCLYFIARDGYTLKRAAEQVCAECGIDLECRYLYCSRLSLRTAEYFLDEEAYLKMLMNGCARLTKNTLFSRIQLNEEERAAVLADISCDDKYSDRIISPKEQAELCRRLSKSEVFCRIMDAKSKRAFELTMDYFSAEGMLSEDTVYIVDSGWCGSVQQSISTLLRAAGATQRVFGYYFGLFSAPREVRRNSRCFYFSPRKHSGRKAQFCNNLLETALSAPHPMTVGYKHSGGRVVPVFSEVSADEEENAVREYISRDMGEYCRVNAAEYMQLSEDKLVNISKDSLIPFMMRPTPEEAEAFSDVMFCDDSSNCYLLPVSEKAEAADFSRLTLLYSLTKRLFHKKAPDKYFIWFGGSAVLSKLKLPKLWTAEHILHRYVKFLISR